MDRVDLSGIRLPEALPVEVERHPGMISQHERRLLYALARDNWAGGQIVDAGVFLGASTVAFGYGLRANANPPAEPSRIILSFDRALVAPDSGSYWFANYAAKSGVPSPKTGETFGPILCEQIAAVSDLVELRLGDICDYKGDDLEQIDICFLDCLKTDGVARHCMSVFFPFLKPSAIVIQQDYFFDQLYFIKTMMERIADRFEYLGEVHTSAVFRLKQKITDADIQEMLDAPSAIQQLSLHRRAEERTKDPSRQYLMRLSRARLLLNLGRIGEASATWHEADQEFAQLVFDQDGTRRPTFARQIGHLREQLDRRARS